MCPGRSNPEVAKPNRHMNNPSEITDRLNRLRLRFKPLPGTLNTDLCDTFKSIAVPLADLEREHCTHDFLVMNPSPRLARELHHDAQLDRLWAHFDPDFL